MHQLFDQISLFKVLLVLRRASLARSLLIFQLMNLEILYPLDFLHGFNPVAQGGSLAVQLGFATE